MVCGLQGSGKTTHCAKLAKYLKKKGDVKNPLLRRLRFATTSRDRATANIGSSRSTFLFLPYRVKKILLKWLRRTLKAQSNKAMIFIIVDTAGRLHIDDELMQQLEKIKSVLKPCRNFICCQCRHRTRCRECRCRIQ